MAEPIREWTLMFFFAGDNALSPAMVSQMKAIKNAGFHSEANVIVQFDPNALGAPTQIYDVNRLRKLRARKKADGHSNDADRSQELARVGDGEDTFVRSFVEDKLWHDSIKKSETKSVRDMVIEKLKAKGLDDDPPQPNFTPAASDTFGPYEALDNFLNFCADNYPARHYMLFILGHGLVVGNDDLFLFDENAPKSFVKLRDFGGLLGNFKAKIVKQSEPGKLHFISFHSCSMSSLEVAYELSGCADYMLASQGPAFVGSWPYTQILMRLFKNLRPFRKEAERAHADAVVTDAEGVASPPLFKIIQADGIREMLKVFTAYCFANSTDFFLAGYSFDLCLCNLTYLADETKRHEFSTAIQRLSAILKKCFEEEAKRSSKPITDHVLLSHWEAQSFWQDNYTDLFDFCLCLLRRCQTLLATTGESANLKEIISACVGLIGNKELLQPEAEATSRAFGLLEEGEDKLIICSRNAGPAYQYSYGLSVYFPWAKPFDNKFYNEEYGQYKFNQEKGGAWIDFLNSYFDRTMRQSRQVGSYGDDDAGSDDTYLGIASLVFNERGQLGDKGSSTTSTGGDKSGSTSSSGGDCGCPSIKNYPRERTPHEQPGVPPRQQVERTKFTGSPLLNKQLNFTLEDLESIEF
jgi:hypothetical protein